MEKITVDAFRRMNIPPGWRQINVGNDSNAESVIIEVPRYYEGGMTDLSFFAMYLKTVSDGGRDDILLSPVIGEDTLTAVWTLRPPQTSYSGTLYIQLRFEGEGFKWETPVSSIEILPSSDAQPVVPVSPSAYDEWLGNLQAVADSVLDLTVSAESLPSGSPASVEKTLSESVYNLNFGIPSGEKGEEGNGIVSVSKTSSSGLTDVYTITFTNGRSTTFTVSNGADGADGNGIVSVEKTGTSGNVDTYTVTLTDGTTATFTVTNGSVTSVNGLTGDVFIDEVNMAKNLTATIYNVDKEPYGYRTTGGTMDVGEREAKIQLTGGTVAWNQLVDTNTTSVTIPSGHKYLANIGGTKTVGQSAGTALSVTGGTDVVHDLTQMFGSSIADYIYTLETNTAGAGVRWFRKLFPNDYYAYNAGELMSVKTSAHKTVGFNAYDHTAGKAKVVGGNEYQITGAYTALSLNGETITPDANGKFTPSANGEITVTGGNSSTTCVHLVWSGYRNGEYEPYESHSYAFDSDLELRGIPKLDSANRLYYDGDTYEPDGSVTRRWHVYMFTGNESWSKSNTWFQISLSTINCPNTSSADGTVVTPSMLYGADYTLATLNQSTGKNNKYGLSKTSLRISPSDFDSLTAEQFAAKMAHVGLIYSIAETTESADPYTETQLCEDYGTEEFIDSRSVAIPVGHITHYPPNLRDKLQHLPNLAEDGVSYLIRQENDYMHLEVYENPLPTAPSEDGTYTLKCTVSSGVATYSWVAGE